MKPGRYRFAVALLLFAANGINYLDRAALGVVAPLIKKDLNLSPSELGVVFSTFFVGYALFAFFGGQLADRYGPRRVYAGAAASWSLLCALTGAVTGFGQLLSVRALFGFAEGPMVSTSNRTISSWFPRQETSRAIGWSFSGQMIGGTLAGPVVGLLALSLGWRTAFFAVGALGLIWVMAWLRWVTDLPSHNSRVGRSERAYIAMGRSAPELAARAEKLPLSAYLMQASTWSLGFGMFAMNYAVYIFLSWLPSYLTSVQRMSLAQTSYVSAIPWAFGFIGYVAGGTVADFAYARFADGLTARKLTTILPLVLAAVALMFVDFAPGARTAVAAIAVAMMFLTTSVQSLWATMHELFPQNRLGGVGGFAHFLSNLSGIIGPAATGVAVQYFGGYGSAFLIASGIAAIGALAMAVFVRRREGLAEGDSGMV